MSITGKTGGFHDHFGAEKEKEKKIGNIATSSQLKKKSTNFSTSRRRNVATSSRFLPQNHKKQRTPNLEASKNVRRRAWKTKQ